MKKSSFKEKKFQMGIIFFLIFSRKHNFHRFRAIASHECKRAKNILSANLGKAMKYNSDV